MSFGNSQTPSKPPTSRKKQSAQPVKALFSRQPLDLTRSRNAPVVPPPVGPDAHDALYSAAESSSTGPASTDAQPSASDGSAPVTAVLPGGSRASTSQLLSRDSDIVSPTPSVLFDIQSPATAVQTTNLPLQVRVNAAPPTGQPSGIGAPTAHTPGPQTARRASTPYYLGPSTYTALYPGYAVPVTPLPRAAAPPRVAALPRSQQPQTTSYRKYRWWWDKLERILLLLHELGWTIGDFLWYLFRVYEPDGKTKVNRSVRQRALVAHFMSGQTKRAFADILELFYAHPSGQPRSAHTERALMFKQKPIYTQISYARPVLSCFAAQICGDRVSRDAIRAVKPQAGLHAHVSLPRAVVPVHATAPVHQRPLVTRRDIGRNVVEKVHGIVSKECSLLYDLATRAADKRPGQVTAVRVLRPTKIVSLTHHSVILC